MLAPAQDWQPSVDLEKQLSFPIKGPATSGPDKPPLGHFPWLKEQSGAGMSYDLESPNGRITAICFTAAMANERVDFTPPQPQ